jgi:hypothetical protein
MWYLSLTEFHISIFENCRYFSIFCEGEFPAGFRQAGHKGCHTSNTPSKL